MRQPTANATQDERRLAQLSEAYNETLAEGCIIGAAAGAGIGAAAYSRNRAQGALIGGLAGALLGCLAGNYMANLQNGYATDEDRLDKVIADLSQENQTLSAMIPIASRVVQDNQARIAELDKAVAAGRMTRIQAEAQLQDLDATRDQLQATVTKAKQRLDDQKRAVALSARNSHPQQVAIASSEIEKKERQIVTLESELDTLTKLRSVSSVG
ncbi:MAG: glycine zipper 2TM domain-containing protein [Gammaproteobacteria bacterium]|nr:glycine zipper 2TM domain-containing protein [Gammaproteobacteria bacterium]